MAVAAVTYEPGCLVAEAAQPAGIDTFQATLTAPPFPCTAHCHVDSHCLARDRTLCRTPIPTDRRFQSARLHKHTKSLEVIHNTVTRQDPWVDPLSHSRLHILDRSCNDSVSITYPVDLVTVWIRSGPFSGQHIQQVGQNAGSGDLVVVHPPACLVNGNILAVDLRPQFLRERGEQACHVWPV